MTTITFRPTTQNSEVSWGDASVWSPAVVPNGADVDIVIPTIYAGQNLYQYFISVGSGQSYSIRSLDMKASYLEVYGELSVSGDLNEHTSAEIDMYGGSLSAGSLELKGFDLQGSGVVNVAGTVVVDSEIIGGYPVQLTVNAASLTNKGVLSAASGNLSITTDSGGFTNLTTGVLTGGTYRAGYATNTALTSECCS